MRRIILQSLTLVLTGSLMAQQRGQTGEDSLHADEGRTASTTIGAYGSATFQRDVNAGISLLNLDRFVLFVGHKFDAKISFFAELEVEDAKVEGDEAGGEVALEQAYLKFNFDRRNSISAGLFIPRIGILNENHLPNTFNGNERTLVETFVIPATWRELGVRFDGGLERVPLYYSVGVMNGLSSEHFEHGTGIRGGRFEGRNALANSIAVTAAVQYRRDSFLAQLSGYVGGTAGLAPRLADSLHLASGPFGTPVMLGEADVQYESDGFALKALGTIISIPDAEQINHAYANNTPRMEYGMFVEAGYDLFAWLGGPHAQRLLAFVRYESLDLNAQIPRNGIADGTLKQSHVVCGLTYLPNPNVAVKVDVRFVRTGGENPALMSNPSPVPIPYKTGNTFLNAGIGFSF